MDPVISDTLLPEGEWVVLDGPLPIQIPPTLRINGTVAKKANLLDHPRGKVKRCGVGTLLYLQDLTPEEVEGVLRDLEPFPKAHYQFRRDLGQ